MESEKLIDLLEKIGIEELTVRNENIMGCCPAHSERRPSWGISVNEPHLHGCFSCGYKGSLKDLLIDVGNYSYSQATATVGDPTGPRSVLSLKQPKRKINETANADLLLLYSSFPDRIAEEVAGWRDIDPEILRRSNCKYHHHDHAILFPWYFNGTLYAITGRPLKDHSIKSIAYGESRKSETLYLPTAGIHTGELILVEGEFDAIKVFDAGFPNVGALGFGNLTDEVIDQILQSNCDKVVAFFDSDETGYRLTRQLKRMLKGRINTRSIGYRPYYYPGSMKLDPGGLTKDQIQLALTHNFSL